MGRVIADLSSIKFVSRKGFRDYAFKVLKGEVGEHVNKGVIIPQMYDMMYSSEMVE